MEQCFKINNTLIEQGYFLKVFEAKKKHNFDEKRQRKTGNEARNLSSCIRPKFWGFDIVSTEYGRKQQLKSIPTDIIYKPIKNGTKSLIVTLQQT